MAFTWFGSVSLQVVEIAAVHLPALLRKGRPACPAALPRSLRHATLNTKANRQTGLPESEPASSEKPRRSPTSGARGRALGSTSRGHAPRMAVVARLGKTQSWAIEHHRYSRTLLSGCSRIEAEDIPMHVTRLPALSTQNLGLTIPTDG